MIRTNICGLSRPELAASVPAPVRLSLDEVKADAKHSGIAQVIGHRITGKILIVLPGGGVWGTTENWFLDEALSVANCLPHGWVNRIDEEVG